jgi:hypothetical protein
LIKFFFAKHIHVKTLCFLPEKNVKNSLASSLSFGFKKILLLKKTIVSADKINSSGYFSKALRALFFATLIQYFLGLSLLFISSFISEE